MLLRFSINRCDGLCASTLAAVVDHRSAITKAKFKVPETATHQREIVHFTDAGWPATSETRIRISFQLEHRPRDPGS